MIIKKYSSIILIIALFIISFITLQNIFSETDDYFDIYGIGIISPISLGSLHQEFNIVDKLSVYKNINKKVEYTIECQDDVYEGIHQECWLVLNKTESVGIPLNEFIMVSYEGFCLKYYEEKGDFVKVLNRLVEGGLWLDKNDLAPHNFTTYDWMTFFLNRGSGLEGYYENVPDMGLNLRRTPDTKYKPIMTLDGENHFFFLTGKTKGLWAYVKVVDDENYTKWIYDSDIKLNYIAEGWIKAIDDKGYPNIAFFMSL